MRNQSWNTKVGPICWSKMNNLYFCHVWFCLTWVLPWLTICTPLYFCHVLFWLSFDMIISRWSYFCLCSLTVENWEGTKNVGRRNPTGDITIILTITIFFIITTFFIFFNITRVLKSSMKVSANILTIKLTMGLTIAHRVTDNQIVQRHHGPRRKGQVIHGPWLRLLIVLQFKYKLYYFTNTGSNSSFN